MNRTKTNVPRWLAGALIAYLACSSPAFAQNKPAGFPSKPIRLVITVAPGAGADAIARAAAQMLTDRWGQTAVVDNRPGGSGVIAAELVANSAQPYILLVNPGMPFKSIKEMVAYSQAQTLSYSGSSGVGSSVHLGMQ